MSLIYKAIGMALIAFLAGCSTNKPKPPTPAPAIVQVPVVSYVPIDKRLTARCSWVKSAPLQEIPSVARGRRKCLEVYEGQFDAIDQVQGKPVPAEPKP